MPSLALVRGLSQRGVRARVPVLVIAVVIAMAGCAEDPPGQAAPTGESTLSPTGFGLAAFGDSVESVTSRLTDRWGPPISSHELKCESSATSKILGWDGVMLVFNSEGMAGYLAGPKPKDAISPAGKDLQTASTTEGLQLGGQIKQARTIYGAKFVLRETSLGPEWFVNGTESDYGLLRGFASGLNENDTVTQIGAGDICAVR